MVVVVRRSSLVGAREYVCRHSSLSDMLEGRYFLTYRAILCVGVGGSVLSRPVEFSVRCRRRRPGLYSGVAEVKKQASLSERGVVPRSVQKRWVCFCSTFVWCDTDWTMYGINPNSGVRCGVQECGLFGCRPCFLTGVGYV